MLKRISGFALLLLVAGVLAMVPSTAGAAQKAGTKLTSSISTSTTPSGSAVTVRGRLVKIQLARPVPGQRIAIQRRVAGTSKWQTVTRVKTKADGTYNAVVRSNVSVDLRARFSGARKLRPSVSGPGRLRVTQFVQVTGQGPVTVDAGENISLSGVTSPGLRGQRVFLDQLISGSWRQIGQATVTDNGTFRVAGTTSIGGFDVQFRARSANSAARPTAVSSNYGFTVYAWYPLSAITPLQTPEANAQSVNFLVKATNTIAGVSYPNSYSSLYNTNGFDKFEDGQAGFAPTTECDAFDVTMGIDDNAGANAAWKFQIYIDGNEYNYEYFEKGDSRRVTINVAAVNKLRLVNHRRVVAPDDVSYRANAVWGGARIKCAGKP